VFSGPGQDRGWAVWAVAGYTAALLLSRRRGAGQAGRAAALAAGAAGAVAGPLLWLAWRAPPTPDVRVVARSAVLLLQHGTPYLPAGQLASPIGYDPYLPGMTVFGLPGAFDLEGVAADPRIWLGLASLLMFGLAFRVAGRTDAAYWAVFAVASPVVAFPLAVGVTDPPVLALICLALALLSRVPVRRPPPGPWHGRWPVWPAALALGVACAMKATAWPALPVIAAMLAARDGARSAVRFAAATVATALGLSVLLAPAAVASPAALVQNTVLFPLGLTQVKTPAASPLPGHLLATVGPAGQLAAISLLLAAGLAIAASLLIRPPTDPPAAARRLAIALTLLFTLSPATRFGYFSYPIVLLGWVAIVRSGLPGPAAGSGPPAAAAPAGPVSVPASPLA
jgi:Glycosyltransferase family 87